MRFLLTAIGSMSAEAAITSLREGFPGCTIVGTDIHPRGWVYLSKKVDVFYRIAKATNKGFISSIRELSKKHNIDFIIPLTDPEVDVLSDKREELALFTTKLALANDETIKLCRNKEKLSNYFAGSPTIDVIRSYNVDGINEVDFNYPVIAKPKMGRSSEGLKVIRSKDELLFLDDNYIVQPLIDGTIITVDLVRDLSGHVVSLPRKELIRTSNGAGLSVKVFQDKRIGKLVGKIAEKLDIIGCMNIEFIANNNTLYLMDINPRFSAGIGFSKLAGYDFIVNHVRVYLQEDIDPIGNVATINAAKHFSDYLLE